MATLRASAPDGIIVDIALIGPNRENIGTINVDFYYDLPSFLSSPYIYNEKMYSDWTAYNFNTGKLNPIDINRIDLIDRAEYYNASGNMEFCARKVENFPLSLQYGFLSNIYNDDTKTVTNSISLSPGTLRIGYNDNKALLFWDSGTKRLPLSAHVKWADIQNIPELALSTDVSSLRTEIYNNFLPLSGGTLTGDISLGTSKGFTGITTSNNKFDVFRIINGNKLQVGGTYPTLILKGSGDRVTYNNNNLAFYSDIPTDFETTTAATNAEKNAKAYADTLFANGDQVNKNTYFNTLTDNGNNSFTLKTQDEKNTATWTANNYYPTQFTWDIEKGSGVQGKIQMVNNGTSVNALNISVPAIPEASITSYGIITPYDQDIGGIKNFDNSIKLSNKIHLLYNNDTESLDFAFLS